MTVHSAVKKSAIQADLFNSTLTLTFANGEEVVVDASKLSENIRHAAMMHGLKQKLVDGAAIARNIETGRSASIEDKHAAVKKIAERLMLDTGTWNEKKDAGTATGGSGNILVRALLHMTGKDESYVKDFLDNKTKEEKAALRKNPKVMAAIAELNAATVSNGINTESLLGELGVEEQAAVPAPVAAAPKTPSKKKVKTPVAAE